MTLAKSFAQAQSSLYGIAGHDIDDIAQDVVLSMLEQRRATPNPFTRNLVRTAVRHAAWAAERAQLGRVRHEEAPLRAAFDRQVETFIQAFGEQPTRLEEDFIAELIRENWHDQKRRPRRGFHRPIVVFSLDDLDDPDVAALWEKLNGGESDDEDEE
jgi:hypothetical protein